MLARYTSEAMAAIWSDQHKIELWHRVELAVIEAYCDEGVFPAEIAALAAEVPPPSWQQVLECEAATGHDVAAFLRAWAADVPDILGSRIHRGLTSSDVVDTALAMQLAETSTILGEQLDSLVSVLRDHALTHLDVARIGRTHGQHATEDTWGHRIAEFAAAAARARTRFNAAADEVAAGKISGPTGTHESVPRAVEHRALLALGLRRSEVSSQIVLRDRIGSWMCEVAEVATLCEAIATEVRLGQLSEIAEVFEPAGPAQVGSSAMPHKRNPIRAEKICGLARVVRGYLIPVLEDVVSWQQRDISHSSVERICLPDAGAAVEHIVHQTANLVAGLTVDAARMALNLSSARTASQTNRAVVVLSDQGIPYLTAYDIVTFAVHITQPTDLIGDVVTAAAARGIDLDVERIRELMTSTPLDLDDVREHLRSL
ncbi:MAG: adenylosuccinate lyase [Mycobacterium sp.]|uniref:adenylosuccinate lyase n=1 Tax=Mycobacterium sp. TaxID=1785 RepID=UPI003F9C03CA